ncbi:PhoH family protein [Microbacterium sp. G2-8]|uniref:PhoH family protein n=1 Tax=Microbacterium sp. G2-8 TaxID=2842454 RepID=UPI001C8B01DB
MTAATDKATRRSAAEPTDIADDQDLRTYVLDTSVLLSDPRALFRFAEHSVVIPVVVVSELEGKRHDPEIGYFARQALRYLDEMRIEHGRLDFPVPTEDGGTVRVELNNSDQSVLPSGMRQGDNDSRILAVAAHLANDSQPVTIVSKDMPMRVKAASLGLTAEEYLAEQAVDSGWTGISSLAVSGDDMADLYESEVAMHEDARGLPTNTGLVIQSERGAALGRVTGADGEFRLVRGDRDVFGLHGRSAEQRFAIDLLLDPEVGIVSLGGRAGTGKSALALCAGLEAVLERQHQKRIIVFRPLFAVGGQELGYLPGDQGEKMNPWGQAVYDTLGSVVSENALNEIMERGLLEVLPLTHIRGRSLHDAFVIVDEAQSLERNVLLTVLSRIGQNSKVVLTHDVQQRDNLRVGRHDGVASVIETLKGQKLFGHVTLTRSERSEIAALVTSLLEGDELS